jgi:hypothetical protein
MLPLPAGTVPVDRELDVENTELSPGVRRLLAVVGSEAPFDHGREQMKLLADLEVTTKTVERTAEAIGGDISARQQEQIAQALQWELPVAVGDALSILYVQIDATGVPVVKKETEGQVGNMEGQPLTPASPSWAVCSRQPSRTSKAGPFGILTLPPTPEPSRRPSSLGGASTPRPANAVGSGRRRKC